MARRLERRREGTSRGRNRVYQRKYCERRVRCIDCKGKGRIYGRGSQRYSTTVTQFPCWNTDLAIL